MSCGETELEENEVEDLELLDVYLPNGLVLDTERVGVTIAFARDLHVGETVKFDYEGGSEGGTRHVLVVKVHHNGIEGLTYERNGGYRHYKDDNVGHYEIVKPFVKSYTTAVGNVKRVNFEDARTALLASLTGEQLAELYGKYVATEGDGAEFDAQNGEVVVTLPQPQNKFKKVLRDKPLVFIITNKENKEFALYVYPDNSTVGFRNDVTESNETNTTPEQLRDELVKFLA